MQSTDIQGSLKQTRAQVIFQVLLFLLWTKDTVWSFAVQVIRRIPIMGQVYEYVIPAMITVAIIVSLPYLLRKARAFDLLFCIGCIVLVLFSYIFHEENQPYIEDQLLTIIISSIPMYMIGVGCMYDECRNVLYWASLTSVIAMLLYQLSLIASGDFLRVYNMSASYKVLPSMMYLMVWAFTHKKIRHWLVVLVCLALSLSYGTRGPIGAICLFFIVGVCVNVLHTKRRWEKWVAVLLASGLVFLILWGTPLMNLAKWMSEQFSRYGFTTRIFDFIISGEFAYDSGRQMLYDIIVESIGQSPVVGYGIMGDRVILDGKYCHNIALEFWCDFGIVFGSALLIVIGVLVYKALRRTWRTKTFFFIAMLVIMTFVKLMFSNSYLIDAYFFFMMGACVAAVRSQPTENLREVE